MVACSGSNPECTSSGQDLDYPQTEHSSLHLLFFFFNSIFLPGIHIQLHMHKVSSYTFVHPNLTFPYAFDTFSAQFMCNVHRAPKCCPPQRLKRVQHPGPQVLHPLSQLGTPVTSGNPLLFPIPCLASSSHINRLPLQTHARTLVFEEGRSWFLPTLCTPLFPNTEFCSSFLS